MVVVRSPSSFISLLPMFYFDRPILGWFAAVVRSPSSVISLLPMFADVDKMQSLWMLW